MNRRANSTCKAKREAILLATADLMSRLGPDVSVTSIARSAAVSKQTVYNHFGSRAGLMDALVASGLSVLYDPMLDLDSNGDPEDELGSYALALLRELSQPAYRKMLRAIFFAIQHDAAAAQLIYDATAVRMRERIATYLRAQCARGRLTVDEPDIAAQLFHTAVVSNAQLMILAGILDEKPIESHARACSRLFLKAYATDR